ncbi:MAG: ECF transporter S component [Vallitaleaceae bacterium]|nr:ECF transporter S component [Vallitaleaceae bacterium]
MKKQNALLQQYSMFQLILIAIIAALGIATKPIITPLVHIFTGPLFIPGGAIAGGFYMLWLVLGKGLVNKPGAATLIGLVQGILVIAIGTMGTHGVMSIITYTLPGLVVDLVFLVSKKKQYFLLHYVVGCLAANVTGTLLSNLLFFRLPFVSLVFILSTAALSGGIGGVIGYHLIKGVQKIKVLDFLWE